MPTNSSLQTHSEPVFLVGAHRSGTTLLRLMLNHHPEISVPGEYDFLTEIMADRTSRPSGSEYLERLKVDRVFLAQSLDFDSTDSFEALVRGFVQQLTAQNPAKVFVAVVHTGFSELARIWPNARFLHLVRDPRDVAASAIKMGWAGNVYTGVKRWVTAESAWDEICGMIPAASRRDIHFESLISDPATILQELCSFLHVPYSGEMLNYHLKTTYDPPDLSLIYQWKKKLSRTEIGLIEGDLGELLRDRGYEASGYPVIDPSWWLRRRLFIQDRIARFRFRMKRYGMWNTVGSAIARRLNLKKAEQVFQLRINEISRQYLT